MTTEDNNGHDLAPIPRKGVPLECNDKCPECGCEERLVANFVAQLKDNKVISQDSFPQAAGVWEIPFIDMKKVNLLQTTEPIRIFPTLRVVWDICSECKKPYIIRVEVGEKGMMNPQALSQQVNNPRVK